MGLDDAPRYVLRGAHRPYTHPAEPVGRWTTTVDSDPRNWGLVMLSTGPEPKADDDEPHEFSSIIVMTPRIARSIAASLIDVADQLDELIAEKEAGG